MGCCSMRVLVLFGSWIVFGFCLRLGKVVAVFVFMFDLCTSPFTLVVYWLEIVL